MTAGRVAEQAGVPGWRRGVALAVAAQLISMMGFSCASSFLPLYIQTIGVPDPARAALWAGGLSFSQAIMVTLCSPVWGAVADRYGAKPMVCRALFGGGVLYIFISFVGQVHILPALFLLLGCFTGVNTAIVTLVAGLAPRKNFSTAIGACQTGVFIDISIGPAIGGFLADTFSYRVGIRSGAVLLLLSGSLVLFGITEARRTATRSSARPSVLSGLRAVGGSRPLFLLIGLIFLIQFSMQMMSPVLPIFVQQLSPNATRIATAVGVIIGGRCPALRASGRSLRPTQDPRLGHRRWRRDDQPASPGHRGRPTDRPARYLGCLHRRSERGGECLARCARPGR